MALIYDENMEERCRSLVGALVLPHSCTLEELVANVAESQHLSIDLQARDFSADPKLSAMVVGTPTGYAIRYDDTSDYWWVLTCVSHELGHILSRHPLMSREPVPPLNPTDVEAGYNGIQIQLADLQNALTTWGALYRCHNHGPHEREAEFIASLLLQRIEATRSSSLSAYLLGTQRPGPEPRLLFEHRRRSRD